MAKKPAKPKKPPTKDSSATSKPGPKPELLEPFDGTFEEAVKLALSKKKPARGWPK